ncbi:MAG: iron-sulfur cluster assembly accessory protein [Cyclobacteriaceae bacterium]|jgi:iron-sulfur cluster assembly protein|nr:iron-sulfur cluster assembly accessory protein [Cyclobacteriaceae bacterium]
MFEQLKPVGLTPKAAQEVRKIMEAKKVPEGYCLRVGVRGGGGCGGATLMIGFDKKKESDLAYTIDSIPVLVDKRHTLYLIGKQVDFYEGSDARGFLFVDAREVPA